MEDQTDIIDPAWDLPSPIPETTPLTARIIAFVLDRCGGIQWEDNNATGNEREFVLCADGARVYFNGDAWVWEDPNGEHCSALDTVGELREAVARW